MSPKDTKKPKREQPFLIKTYLLLYNLIQTIGWTYLLFQIIWYYIRPQPNAAPLYDLVKWTVIVFQNAAVLEILHSAINIVPSNVIITTFQVFSRVMVVCGVLIPTLEGRSSLGLPLALIAWSFAEIIRYSYYTLNLVKMVPYFVIWLRYTGFIILYPVGVTGELLCLYGAQNEVSRTNLWTVELPNILNFSFHYQHFLVIVMLLYLPLFPQMYLHMFGQRKKMLR